MTDQVVDVADRATTVARLTEALSALKTGRNGGQETLGLPAPMRRAAAEGLADLGFRLVEAVATHRVVMPEKSWLGPHANGEVAAVDKELAHAVLADINPEMAARVAAATTDEEIAAGREALRPDVEATLQTGLSLDEATSALRMQGKYDAAAEREKRDAEERGE
nr:hypothetical protein [Mycobacterium sp. UM_NZ2]